MRMCVHYAADDACFACATRRPRVPRAAWAPVAPGLWQGGSWWPPGDRFGAVLTLWRGAPPAWRAAHERRFCVPDGPVPDAAGLRAAVDWAAGMRADGHDVLVRCKAGLNRSGLVVALLLVEQDLMAPSEAIDRVRAARTSHALCNPLFTGHLLGLEAL